MFSIIIPLYNKQNYIATTMQSVLRQTFSDFEVIVVNDSSTDDSLRIVKEFTDDRITVHTIPNGGVSAARNYGIARATREYICFLDADDTWSPDYLEAVRRMIATHPGCTMYGTSYTIRNRTASRRAETVFSSVEPYHIIGNYCKMVGENGYTPFWTSAVCAPRCMFDTVGGFAPGINAAEDLDMWLRLGLAGKVCFHTVPLATYMADSENNFRTRTNWQNIFPYAKWYSYAPKNSYLKRYASMMLINLAQIANRRKDYRYSLEVLRQIRGSDFILKKTVYAILSTLKISF